MNVSDAGFIILAALFAGVDWIAVGLENRRLEYVCKPAVMVALLAAAVTLDPNSTGQRAWFVVALVLCLIGDVLLMLPRDLFVAGLVAFLLGHLAYVAGFRVPGVGGSVSALLISLAGVIVVDMIVGRPIVAAVRRKQREMLGPVLGYIAVISLMVASALATGNPLAAAGAVLFFA